MNRPYRLAAFAAALAIAACGGTSPTPPADDGPPATPEPAAPTAQGPQEAPGADSGAAPPGALPEPPPRLEIALRGAEALSLVEFLGPGQRRGQGTVQLVGEVAVSITNPSASPVRLIHMDPANLVFTRVDSGAAFSLLHPCDPGALLGWVAPVAAPTADGELRGEGNTVFTLRPGETRTFPMGREWGCSGGAWKPLPEPGEYRVEYRIHRVEPGWSPEAAPPDGATLRARLEAARSALAGDRFWEGAYRSAPVPISFGAPRAQRIDL